MSTNHSSKKYILLALASLVPGTFADPLVAGLMDPDSQVKFETKVAEVLAEDFKIVVSNGLLKINAYKVEHTTGLKDESGNLLKLQVFGYGPSRARASWPGSTLEVQKDKKALIQWGNALPLTGGHPFTSLQGKSVVDTSLHWAYSLAGYDKYKVGVHGIPIVTHLHGAHSGPDIDGNPEHFFTRNWRIKGPDWKFKNYLYRNDQPAATLWYHDHALGITRLNVHAGLAGFYIIRDDQDTGKVDNPLSLPAGDFEKAYAIQDRMFKDNGELFYPAYKGEPSFDDFIGDTMWDHNEPTALAELFGDFIVVNGKVWPKQEVEPRCYRLRLLNGCDSRFLVVKFLAVAAGETEVSSTELPYTIVGTDQGL